MKATLKLSTFLVALTSIFTFSSCLDSNDSNGYATYSSYVTISGDIAFGYTFHSDFGAILRPTTASVQEVLPGLSNSNVKRAFVAFDLASETENGSNLEAGKTYDIVLRQSYYANYALPTYKTIELTEASDSLRTNNERINNIDPNIWAINGYVNAQLTINYHPNQTFYLNTYYSEEDIDVANNTLYLNLYYSSKSENPLNQGSSVISFDLPEQIAGKFSTDSVKLVLRAKTGYDDQTMTEAGSCTVAKKDFFIPSY